MSSNWYVTAVEVYKDGTRLIYHRNGGPFAVAGSKDVDKASKSWTHPIDDPRLPDGEPCPACPGT